MKVSTDSILRRFGLMRAINPVADNGRMPDLVVRQTISRESGANLGVMHEAKCKHCDWSVELDTLVSIMERGRRHLLREHGIRIDRMRDVKLGQEHWD